MSNLDIKSYMNSHEYKDAQIIALSEALEESFETILNVSDKCQKVISERNDILNLTKHILDDMMYLVYCGHCDSDFYLRDRLQRFKEQFDSYLY